MTTDLGSKPIIGTHTYTTAPGWKIFTLVVGAVMTIGSLVAAWFIHADADTTQVGAAYLYGFASLFTLFGMLMVIATLRYRVELTRDGIEVQQTFGRRKLRWSEIASRRTLKVPNSPAIIELIPKDSSKKKLQISRSLRTDRTFEDWIAAIPDQNELDQERLEKDVAADPAYGANPAERSRRLTSLRTLTKWLNWAGLAIGLWGMIYPHPYRLVIALLFVCPLIGLAFVVGTKGKIHIDQKANDTRPSVINLMITPAMALALRALLDVDVMDWQPVLLVALVGGPMLMLIAAYGDAEMRSWPKVLLLASVIGVPYVYGTTMQLNFQLDDTPPQVFETKVLDKHESSGKHHTWYLTVAPWGPDRVGGDESVGSEFYDQTSTGDTICVALNPGALGWRWYWLDRCPDKQ